MNAEELQIVLLKLKRAIAYIEPVLKAREAYRHEGSVHIRALDAIWSELDDHRLEMEAAEAKPAQTLDDIAQDLLRNSGLAPEVDHSARFDAIEKRLGILGRAHIQMKAMHGIRVDPATLIEIG